MRPTPRAHHSDHARPHRGDTLRRVIATADERRDGVLPTDVPGVAETFHDALDLLGALQLRWHTRLSGRIERELMVQPLDLESAVVAAWRAVAEEMPGVRMVLDQHRAHPGDPAMAEAMRRATAKERTMLAVLAGRVSGQDAAAVRIGEHIEARARAGLEATPAPRVRRSTHRTGLLDRLRAVLAA